jgi:hypothetical protein
MSHNTVEDSFELAEQVWAPVIGQFILEFATIEDFLHSIISEYLKNKHVTESDLKDSLPSRLSMFKKIVSERLDSQQDRQKLNSSVDGIANLVKTRNLLAHNSLSLEMEETQEGTIRAIGPVISGRRDPNMTITLGTLRLRLSDLKRHRNEMSDFLSLFHTHIPK